MMARFGRNGICVSIITAGILALAASPATAAKDTMISSSGDGLDVSVTLTPPILPPIVVGIGPLASASGSAPGPYNSTNSVVTLDAITSIGGLLNFGDGTGVLTGTASSPFMPTPTGTGIGTLAETGGVADTFGLFSLLGSPLLEISADTISSTSDVSGFGSFLTATGQSTITDLTISGSLLGAPITISGTINPTVNDVIFNSGGILIELNKQVVTGAGGFKSTGESITTDALYIQISNLADSALLGTDLLSADIAVGQSFAGITQVLPEPSAWALMLTGFAGLGAALRVRRRRTAVVA